MFKTSGRYFEILVSKLVVIKVSNLARLLFKKNSQNLQIVMDDSFTLTNVAVVQITQQKYFSEISLSKIEPKFKFNFNHYMCICSSNIPPSIVVKYLTL